MALRACSGLRPLAKAGRLPAVQTASSSKIRCLRRGFILICGRRWLNTASISRQKKAGLAQEKTIDSRPAIEASLPCEAQSNQEKRGALILENKPIANSCIFLAMGAPTILGTRPVGEFPKQASTMPKRPAFQPDLQSVAACI